jgi:hypothetical protein
VRVDTGQITAISVTTVKSGAATGAITLTGGDAGDGTTIKAAFALTGQCGTLASRYGENYVTSPAPPTLPTFSIPYKGTYKACYSLDDGVTWSEQSAPSLDVSTSMFCFHLTFCRMHSRAASGFWVLSPRKS